MKILGIALLISLLYISPVFAVGNVTVTGRDLVPNGNYTNTNTSVAMLNLSFEVTTETGSRTVNITLLNISLGNGSTVGNISAVEIYLSNDTRVIGSAVNSMNSTAFNITLSSTFVVNSSSNASVIVRFNISRNATTRQLLSAILGSATDVGVNDGSNVTVSGGQSNATQLQDIHANVSISPRFVDTNVINQTLVYTIVPTGRDGINRTIITIPSGYNLTNVSTVEVDGSNTTSGVTTTTAPNYINVTITTPTTQKIKVTFNVNTSATRVDSSAFTSTIDGGNRSGIPTEAVSPGTNATIQQIINVTSITIAKAAAIVNGTDYWEFNLTLNFTSNLTGLIQFKMSNWTDASSPPNHINTNVSSTYYATLRNNSNFSDTNGKFNVTNVYVENWGLNQTITESGTLTLILRMIIPTGTAISSTWAATYNFLFRPSP